MNAWSSGSARPERPDFVVHRPAARTDPTTPRQAEQLHENDLDELVQFLKTWTPVPGLGNPTSEGLARKLAAVVATEPVKFAEAARTFIEIDPAYVWAMLHGLREAAEGYEFEWSPVLDLAVVGGCCAARVRCRPLAPGPSGGRTPDLPGSWAGPVPDSVPLSGKGLVRHPPVDRRP